MTQSVETKFRRALWLSLILVLVLTACSGKTTQTNNGGLNTTSLDGRQAPSAAAAELPKATEPVAPAAGYLPAETNALDLSAQAANPAPAAAAKVGAISGAQPAGGAPAAEAQPAADAQPAAAMSEPYQAPEVQVDMSLPQEPTVGSRAPDFSLQTLDGKTVTMAEMIGHPVVISYWATWCVPCKQELPILQRLNEQYADQGLVVLTVNAIDQDTMEDVQAQAQAMGLTAPVLLDSGSAFSEAYQAAFFPSTYFIDPAGVIRAIKLGDSTEADLTGKIQSLLAGTL